MLTHCVIVVPIYKTFSSLDKFEVISFKQLIRVFSSRDIAFITYRELDISQYLQQFKQEDCRKIYVEYFNQSDFVSTSTYNDLMISADFYHRFMQYDYMLIYQLDAYVFEDKLDYWMSKGYDYVGAPWFRNYGAYESDDDLWEVGNGGLSLRNVAFYHNLLTYKGLLYCGVDIKHGLYQFIKSIVKSFGYHNTLSWYKRRIKGKLNEDCFLSYYLREITNKQEFVPYIPSAIDAIDFAFEKSPSYLYERNGQRLPMGCHAFAKYEYEDFWSKYIKNETINNND